MPPRPTPRQLRFAALVEGRKKTRPQVPAEPFAIRREYTALLRAYVALLRREAMTAVKAATPGLLAQQSKVATLDARDVGGVIDLIDRRTVTAFDRKRVGKRVKLTAEQLAVHQKRQLERQLAVTVDVFGAEPWLAKAADEFVEQNVALVRDVKAQTLSRLERELSQKLADGARASDLVDTVKETLDVSESRAKLIARDQVSKYQGDLARVRQTELGIVKYIWRTGNDERVRDEHKALEGKEFAWGEDAGGEGAPGEPVNCRCYAEPVLEGLIGAF